MKKKMILPILILVLSMTSLMIYAQEDPGYTFEEYSYYQKAQKETDLNKKEAALFEFLQKFPDQNKLMPYIIGEFQKLFNARIQKKQYNKVISAANKLLKIRKNEIVAYNGLATASYQKKDFPSYVKYAEIIYKQKPSPTLAYYISDAAITAKDYTRAEKYLSSVSKGGTLLMKIDLVTKLFKSYMMQKNTQGATGKAKKLITLFEKNPNKPTDFKGGNWGTYKNNILKSCYDFLAKHCMEKQNYAGAIAAFLKLMALNNNDASLHLRLGMAYWLDGKATMAAPELAMSVALNDDNISPKAEAQLRKMLEKNELTGKALEDKYKELLDDAKLKLNLP